MFDQMLHAKRLFRPLMPRPINSPRDYSMFSATPNPCFLNCCSSRAKNIFAWNSSLNDVNVQQSETELLNNNGELVASSRWNPAAEQIQALEELYKKGLRTPSAEQIQKIAAKLRNFGNIEGKNVFYWFQNHKARERQKRRRLLEVNNHPQLAKMNDNNVGIKQRLKEPEANVKIMDGEPGAEKCNTYSSCSSISEDYVSKNRTVKAESSTNVWAQFDEEEFQQQTKKSKRIKKATLQIDMSPLPNYYYYIFSTRAATQQSSIQSCDHTNEEKIGNRENQILELFPLGRSAQSDISVEEEESKMLTRNNVIPCPRQFFEFLPLKS